MLTINRDRFLRLMQEQAAIGRSSGGGLTRPSLSPADIEARNWFKLQIEAHSLDYQMDGAGNQSGILKSDNPQAKTLLIGSHLDSVPNGGRFDGALGVVAALEAAGRDVKAHVIRRALQKSPFVSKSGEIEIEGEIHSQYEFTSD